VIAEWRDQLRDATKDSIAPDVVALRVAGDNPEWFTVLDERFLIRATSRELVVEAARRGGMTWRDRVSRSVLPIESSATFFLTIARHYNRIGEADLLAPFGNVRRRLGDIESLTVVATPDRKWCCAVRAKAVGPTIKWLGDLGVSTCKWKSTELGLVIGPGDMFDRDGVTASLVRLFGFNLVL